MSRTRSPSVKHPGPSTEVGIGGPSAPVQRPTGGPIVRLPVANAADLLPQRPNSRGRLPGPRVRIPDDPPVPQSPLELPTPKQAPTPPVTPARRAEGRFFPSQVDDLYHQVD